ncbi:phosphate-starvation-inducible PsiE family protein [Methanoregula sp.]|uniref:phosphate-starvation-inducible PsiE family protein n=1 Tax=Methanoregula sp. TaxID=2052170 RepID=UPI003BB04A81
MPENPPAKPVPVQQTGLEYVIRFFSLVPMAMYMIVAAMLTIIAFFSVYDAAQQIVSMITLHDFADGLLNVIYSLLLTITIIVLFETVTVYFRTKHVEVRALLIAGLTGMVRHILIYNVATTDAIQMFATVALLAVLIAGIVLVKSEVAASPI